ncbi:MAG: M60 family metallopeptidase [Bacteroidaceae bacterium]|nr:M60 family metallopeptidase [Bacteroidaceae bacterium]
MKRFFYSLALMLATVFTLQAQTFPEDGATYRIINMVRDNAVLIENYLNNELNGGAESSLCNDVWRFTKSGEGWNIQNVLTERYVQIESSNSRLYRTDTTPAVFYVVENKSFTKECYNLVNEKGGRWGIHCETDNDVVPWYSATDELGGSEWTYARVDVSDEQITAARIRVEELSNLYNNQEAISEIYSSHFEDVACTILKSEYAAMSDDELTASLAGCGSELIAIAQKIKNDAWADREKEFRVCTYGPYSNPDHWGEIVKTKYYSWLNNPTGICATGGDVLYVFVGADPKEGSTLEIDAIVNNSSKGKRTELKKGMNVIPVIGKDLTYFIIYTADTRKDKVLADFDSIPIHIEGGYVNGYWDKQRHNDDDWVDLTRNHAKHKYMFVRGDRMMYFMNRKVMISSDVCPNTITDAIGWWDNMVMWQQEIMGLEEYRPSRYNNRLCAVSFDGDGLMSATNHVTSYVEDCLHDVLPIEDIWEESGHCWGPSHEVGHVHQNLINMIACAEASNNLFSNISVFNLGKFVTWGDGIEVMSDYYMDAVPWTLQGIGLKMRMYFQLYLYYHVCGHDTQFYPKLFKLLRANPMKKTSGGATNFGRYDLLYFAEKCAEAAGEDLTKFFEAWGFFHVMNKVEASDYGDYLVTSTQSMIDNTKAVMDKYPKKAAAIEFIEDRVDYSPRTDGGEGYKLEYEHGKFGNVGQYTAYMADSIDTQASGYIYTKSGNKFTFSGGTGAVGFKIYDADSTLLTFTNFYEIELTNEMVAKDLIIVAVSADGTESTVNDKRNGSEEDQLEALNQAIVSAEAILSLKDTGYKNVGYFYASVIDEFTPFVDSVKAVVENKDQSLRSYGEWAILLDKKIVALTSDENNRVQLHSGNTYQLYNVQYPKYSMYCENGVLTCKSGTTTPKSRRFTFTSTGNDNEYYISCNGTYINSIGRSQQAKATSSKKADALTFIVGEHGVAKYYMYKTGDTGKGIHCDQSYKVVGWNHTDDPSLWTLVCTDLKKEKADLNSLKALVTEATSIHDLIVDTTNTASISFKEGIEVTSETLAADVEAMMTKVAQAQDVVTNKYYEKTLALIDELTAIIATVNAGYTVSTGIGGILFDEADAVIYDARGRKVKNITSPGIYIVNGKKVYVK